MKTIYLAGGCFWGTEHFLKQFDAVKETTVGFANGTTEHPTYQEVCHNGTGHAETVKVVYDEEAMSTEELLRYYFMTIDPISVNRQGGDVGTQYRTGIYYEDASLLPAIEKVIAEEEVKAGQKLAVEVKPLENFYDAEEYHQDYLVKNPGGYCHIPLALMHLTSR
ncbi:MAG: peptide-methionine (S)-S-oxide reductase MsrA [Lachnospiraceae bacterium]|nr:peptide-methionine (S)-S-oxide reductase MsrA [Lachnospiraceae bacterium]